MRRLRVVGIGTGVVLWGLGAGTAHAAPPPNDAASRAVEVAPVAAENGPVPSLEGVAELGEATPDIGTPRCLGPKSFQRTVWFRVPGGPAQRVRLDALTASGQPDQAADLAAYVQPVGVIRPLTTEPQACDGPATRATDPGIELNVPPGQDVLVQVGFSAGRTASRAILSASTLALPQLEPPRGDAVADAVGMPFARARTQRLRGATVTERDPAEPACATAGSIWRRRPVRQTGEQVASTRGRDASALTAFVGKRPSGTNAKACRTANSSRTTRIEVPFRARKGQIAWLRIGTDKYAAGRTRTAVSGPCDPTPLHPITRTRVTVGAPARRARGKRTVRLRVRLVGPCLRQARITVRRGKRIVARRTLRTLVRGTVTVRVPRVRGAKVPKARYKVSVAGRAPKAKRQRFGVSRRVRLR